MQNLNWLSIFIYFGLITVFILAFLTLLIVGIIRINQKKSIKVPILILLSLVIVFSAIRGGVAINNYQKDKWFYDFRSQITKQYVIVKNIELDAGTRPLNPDFQLYFYCDKNAEIKDIEPVFNAVKNYLFNNPSGTNPSQQSRTKRGQGEYTTIDLFFYTSTKTNTTAKVIYEAGYYTDGLQNKIDNFKTWSISDGNWGPLPASSSKT